MEVPEIDVTAPLSEEGFEQRWVQLRLLLVAQGFELTERGPASFEANLGAGMRPTTRGLTAASPLMVERCADEVRVRFNCERFMWRCWRVIFWLALANSFLVTFLLAAMRDFFEGGWWGLPLWLLPALALLAVMGSYAWSMRQHTRALGDTAERLASELGGYPGQEGGLHAL